MFILIISKTLISRRHIRDFIIKVLRYSCKIPDIFLRFYAKLNILHLFIKKSPNINVKENPFSGSWVVPRYTKKLTVVFVSLALTHLKKDKQWRSWCRPSVCVFVCLSVWVLNSCTNWTDLDLYTSLSIVRLVKSKGCDRLDMQPGRKSWETHT